MHELAIAEGIADVVTRSATEHGATRVKNVHLRIGEASGVVPDSLSFCFELLAGQTPLLTGAKLSIDVTPHRAWCRGCAREFQVRDFVSQCPDCQEWSDRIVSGTELQVVEMEIETRQDAE